MPVAIFIHLYEALSGMMGRKRNQPINGTIDGFAPLFAVLFNDQTPILTMTVFQ